MSTKERVIKIIDNWTEKQLEGFLVMFGADAFDETDAVNDTANQAVDEKTRRKYAAHEEIKKMRKKVPKDFDYDKELAEYREEKYGH